MEVYSKKLKKPEPGVDGLDKSLGKRTRMLAVKNIKIKLKKVAGTVL